MEAHAALDLVCGVCIVRVDGGEGDAVAVARRGESGERVVRGGAGRAQAVVGEHDRERDPELRCELGILLRAVRRCPAGVRGLMDVEVDHERRPARAGYSSRTASISTGILMPVWIVVRAGYGSVKNSA